MYASIQTDYLEYYYVQKIGGFINIKKLSTYFPSSGWFMEWDGLMMVFFQWGPLFKKHIQWETVSLIETPFNCAIFNNVLYTVLLLVYLLLVNMTRDRPNDWPNSPVVFYTVSGQKPNLQVFSAFTDHRY